MLWHLGFIWEWNRTSNCMNFMLLAHFSEPIFMCIGLPQNLLIVQEQSSHWEWGPYIHFWLWGLWLQFHCEDNSDICWHFWLYSTDIMPFACMRWIKLAGWQHKWWQLITYNIFKFWRMCNSWNKCSSDTPVSLVITGRAVFTLRAGYLSPLGGLMRWFVKSTLGPIGEPNIQWMPSAGSMLSRVFGP